MGGRGSSIKLCLSGILEFPINFGGLGLGGVTSLWYSFGGEGLGGVPLLLLRPENILRPKEYFFGLRLKSFIFCDSPSWFDPASDSDSVK